MLPSLLGFLLFFLAPSNAFWFDPEGFCFTIEFNSFSPKTPIKHQFPWFALSDGLEVFNTLNPAKHLTFWGSPHKDFFGKGEGAGGGMFGSGGNTKKKQNVLVFSDQLAKLNAGKPITKGATARFSFILGMSIKSIDFLDAHDGGVIRGYDQFGRPTGVIPIPARGANSVELIYVGLRGTWTIEIEFKGRGCIVSITFCWGEQGDDIDGGWSAWGPCPTCGPATQNRTCTNPPPQNKGKNCTGPSSQPCPIPNCPPEEVNQNCTCTFSNCSMPDSPCDKNAVINIECTLPTGTGTCPYNSTAQIPCRNESMSCPPPGLWSVACVDGQTVAICSPVDAVCDPATEPKVESCGWGNWSDCKWSDAGELCYRERTCVVVCNATADGFNNTQPCYNDQCDNPCKADNVCKHGGVCTPAGRYPNMTVDCECKSGFVGDRCEMCGPDNVEPISVSISNTGRVEAGLETALLGSIVYNCYRETEGLWDISWEYIYNNTQYSPSVGFAGVNTTTLTIFQGTLDRRPEFNKYQFTMIATPPPALAAQGVLPATAVVSITATSSKPIPVIDQTKGAYFEGLVNFTAFGSSDPNVPGSIENLGFRWSMSCPMSSLCSPVGPVNEQTVTYKLLFDPTFQFSFFEISLNVKLLDETVVNATVRKQFRVNEITTMLLVATCDSDTPSTESTVRCEAGVETAAAAPVTTQGVTEYAWTVESPLGFNLAKVATTALDTRFLTIPPGALVSTVEYNFRCSSRMTDADGIVTTLETFVTLAPRSDRPVSSLPSPFTVSPTVGQAWATPFTLQAHLFHTDVDDVLLYSFFLVMADKSETLLGDASVRSELTVSLPPGNLNVGVYVKSVRGSKVRYTTDIIVAIPSQYKDMPVECVATSVIHRELAAALAIRNFRQAFQLISDLSSHVVKGIVDKKSKKPDTTVVCPQPVHESSIAGMATREANEDNDDQIPETGYEVSLVELYDYFLQTHHELFILSAHSSSPVSASASDNHAGKSLFLLSPSDAIFISQRLSALLRSVPWGEYNQSSLSILEIELDSFLHTLHSYKNTLSVDVVEMLAKAVIENSNLVLRHASTLSACETIDNLLDNIHEALSLISQHKNPGESPSNYIPLDGTIETMAAKLDVLSPVSLTNRKKSITAQISSAALAEATEMSYVNIQMAIFNVHALGLCRGQTDKANVVTSVGKLVSEVVEIKLIQEVSPMNTLRLQSTILPPPPPSSSPIVASSSFFAAIAAALSEPAAVSLTMAISPKTCTLGTSTLATQCYWWDSDASVWSSQGCTVRSATSTSISCSCQGRVGGEYAAFQDTSSMKCVDNASVWSMVGIYGALITVSFCFVVWFAYKQRISSTTAPPLQPPPREETSMLSSNSSSYWTFQQILLPSSLLFVSLVIHLVLALRYLDVLQGNLTTFFIFSFLSFAAVVVVSVLMALYSCLRPVSSDRQAFYKSRLALLLLALGAVLVLEGVMWKFVADSRVAIVTVCVAHAFATLGVFALSTKIFAKMHKGESLLAHDGYSMKLDDN